MTPAPIQPMRVVSGEIETVIAREVYDIEMDPREARCHLIAAVLTADGILTEDERRSLLEAVVQAKLDDEARHRVLALGGRDEAVAVMRGQPEEARRALIDELVDAALVDGKLTPTETAEVKRLAAALDVA